MPQQPDSQTPCRTLEPTGSIGGVPAVRVYVDAAHAIEICWVRSDGLVTFWQIRPRPEHPSYGITKDGRDAIDQIVLEGSVR